MDVAVVVDVDAASVKKGPSNLCLRAWKDNRVGDLPHHQMQVDAEVEEVVEVVVDVDVDAVNYVMRQTTSSEEERGEVAAFVVTPF